MLQLTSSVVEHLALLLCCLGVSEGPSFEVFPAHRRSVAGAFAISIRENFGARHGIGKVLPTANGGGVSSPCLPGVLAYRWGDYWSGHSGVGPTEFSQLPIS